MLMTASEAFDSVTKALYKKEEALYDNAVSHIKTEINKAISKLEFKCEVEFESFNLPETGKKLIQLLTDSGYTYRFLSISPHITHLKLSWDKECQK